MKITCTCSPSGVSFIKNKWMEQREGDLVTAARKLGVQTRTAWPENLSPRGTDGKRCRYILLKALFRFSLTLCLCLGLTLLLISAWHWDSAQKTLVNTTWNGIPLEWVALYGPFSQTVNDMFSQLNLAVFYIFTFLKNNVNLHLCTLWYTTFEISEN